MEPLSVTLAALYLRGGERPIDPRRSAWMDVLRVLRRSACEVCEAGEALRDAGYWAEGLVLESPGLIDWAERQVAGGRVLAACDADYPCRWLRVLGPSAPPVLWRQGEVPGLPCIGVVGSRRIPSTVASFCSRAAQEAVHLGFSVVSGRAAGCDQAAARGARTAGGGLIEILPHGIDLARPAGSCLLSVCAPLDPFSAPAAMERNALIYACASHTLIGQARFKEGGTWHGAVHAIRSRLSSLMVRRSDDIAMRSLAALGGNWIDHPRDLALALKYQGQQAQLFGSAG